MAQNIRKFFFALWLTVLVVATMAFMEFLALNAAVKQYDMLVARAHGARHVP